MRTGWIAPLSLDSAVACFREWNASHASPPFALRERYARDLARLFDIGSLGEMGRYTLYRRTAFADAREETKCAFDALLDEMHRFPGVPPTRLPAMNALLDSLQSEDERHALLRMVSPSADTSRHALTTVEGVQVLQRRVPGRTGEIFILRDAVTAAEIGMLYDLFLREQFPVVISEGMQYLVLVDEWHRIEGGAGYAFEADGSLSVELLIIDPAVRGMGLGAAVIDELGHRACDRGATQLRAPYYLRKFCLRMGFADDADNGDLRRAVPPQPRNADPL
jgi:GNAT superfamily N-acetyltransferase